jgi:hypothetical protein
VSDKQDDATRLVTALLAGNESLRDRLEAMDKLLNDASEEIERLKQPEARWYETAMKMLSVAPNHVAASFNMGGRRVEITFYNEGGKTPGEVAAELRVEVERMKAAWKALSDAAGCEDLRPDHHGEAVLRFVNDTMGQAAKVFEESRTLRIEVEKMRPIVEAARSWSIVSTAYAVNRLADAVDAYEKVVKRG